MLMFPTCERCNSSIIDDTSEDIVWDGDKAFHPWCFDEFGDGE